MKTITITKDWAAAIGLPANASRTFEVLKVEHNLAGGQGFDTFYTVRGPYREMKIAHARIENTTSNQSPSNPEHEMRMYDLKKIALETPVSDAQSFDDLTTVDTWERIIYSVHAVTPRYGDVERTAWSNWSNSLNL